jgi:SAM-dependent methyltransferase
VTEDLFFYSEMARRTVLDLGCGSGRLFRSFLDGGARTIIGLDGSEALLRRARLRIQGDPRLAAAFAAGRIKLIHGDVRALSVTRLVHVHLVVAAGVVPHLDGPDELLRMLTGVRALLADDGRLIIDDIGPGRLPTRDLPLSVDWRRKVRGRDVVRRSSLVRRQAPEGLRVTYSTITDSPRPDSTIGRYPSSHRLWYPPLDTLRALVAQAEMRVELTYGSHDLEPLAGDSERQILMVTR